MRIALTTPPFDCESLTRSFGFRVPLPFVTLLNVLCQDCGSAEVAYERIDDSLEWLLAGNDQRYQQTPPELFPIAATGVDGGHFGYVIHAPELPASDYPIARFEPMDNDGAYLLGGSTFEAAETQMSKTMRNAQEFDSRSLVSFEWWPEVSARLAQLGIVPDPGKAKRNYENGNGKPVAPTVLDGWRHVQGSDGVGVLAPAAQFHPSVQHSIEDRPNVSLVLETASRYSADHFPATALWLLRECYWRTWAPFGHDTIALCRAMIDTYHSLGRPSLAAIVDNRIEIFR